MSSPLVCDLPPIPSDAVLFWHPHHWEHEEPHNVHEWQWSYDFNRWSAFVTFRDGQQIWTYPK